jgi:hypothetical protein
MFDEINDTPNNLPHIFELSNLLYDAVDINSGDKYKPVYCTPLGYKCIHLLRINKTEFLAWPLRYFLAYFSFSNNNNNTTSLKNMECNKA